MANGPSPLDTAPASPPEPAAEKPFTPEERDRAIAAARAEMGLPPLPPKPTTPPGQQSVCSACDGKGQRPKCPECGKGKRGRRPGSGKGGAGKVKTMAELSDDGYIFEKPADGGGGSATSTLAPEVGKKDGKPKVRVQLPAGKLASMFAGALDGMSKAAIEGMADDLPAEQRDAIVAYSQASDDEREIIIAIVKAWVEQMGLELHPAVALLLFGIAVYGPRQIVCRKGIAALKSPE